MLSISTSGCGLTSLDRSRFHERSWEQFFLKGESFLQQDAYSRAVKQLEQARDQSASLGQDIRVAITHDRLAKAYDGLEKDEQALAEYGKALALYDKMLESGYGGKSGEDRQLLAKELISTLASRGFLEARRKDFDAAQASFRRVIEVSKMLEDKITRTTDKQVGHEIVRSLYGLGKIYEQSNQLDAARQAYTKAIRTGKHLRVLDESVAPAYSGLQRVLARSGKPDTDRLLAEKDRPVKSVMIDEVYSQWTRYQSEGETAFRNGMNDDAISSFRRAIAQAVRLGESDKSVIKSRRWLIRVLNTTKRFADAEQAIDDSQYLLDGAPLNKDFELLLGEICNTYKLQHKWAELEKIQRTRIEVREELWGSEHFRTGEALRELGKTLLREKKFDEAKTALHHSLLLLRQHYAEDSAKITSTKKLFYQAASRYNINE